MLIERGVQKRARRSGRERRLWHRPDNRHTPLGCPSCPEFAACAGLRTNERLFDCLSLCCGKPGQCTRVCRLHPEFARRVREIGGFDLDNVPRAAPLVSPTLPRVIPVIYHGSRLRQPLSVPAVGIPLYKMCGRNGVPRYHSAEELCESFNLDPETRIVLTGTALDPPLERWWGLETSGRLTVIRALRKCGIELVTTPNFSLIANVPRWSDLHAMKRIAITCYEFISEGVPATLHVNARTGADFFRWAEYIAPRSELTHIAFEFTTGPRRTERRQQHVQWLQELARAVGRPLNLVLRGGAELDPELRSSFNTITFFATSAFMKTTHRQRATLDNGLLSWTPSPTGPEEPLDELLANNIAAETAAMGARVAEVDFTATP